MNNFKVQPKTNDGPGEVDDLFDDSSVMAHFENNSFKDRSNFSKSVINDSLNNSDNPLNVSALCCDEEISGYDRLTGKTWIYPTNYPVRDYQFNIIRAALLKNTLVSLPTGLGKTFIAAVIMYNFYRWYPLGKIVFTAPTRPLVAQQIDACYNIIAIPPSDTIEMTGVPSIPQGSQNHLWHLISCYSNSLRSPISHLCHMPVATRKLHWQNKRVFFATPQVIYNDIKSGICPGEKIRCLVVDEAHRARGNYAYCQIVTTLADMKHNTYRMLALSATPGSRVEDVINVVKHLNIAHLELRTENCIDVAPYSHSRKINTVVVQLGPQLSQLRNHYIEILDGYARRLKQMNILPHNVGNLSKGRIVMLYKEYQGKERGNRHPQHNYIMKDFTLLIALYHGLELLVKHGARVFLNFFDEHPEKAWIQADDRLTVLLERLRDDLGVNPMSLDTSVLPDGSVPDIPKDLCFGHPKFDKLKEIMMEHFQTAKRNGQDTKAIVFCEYRESVNLVHRLLLQCRPLIVPQMFVGQGASGKDGKTVVSQKQQLRVMRQFREGACNALVATCVCEEGLDVGSVDLILCFDISTASPVRLVQRCGRTGRERGGKVYILVTEGREHQTLMDCMRRRDGLNAKILQSREVANTLYQANPRMMPRDLTPACQKMFITVNKNEAKDNKEDKIKRNQKDLRSMLTGASTSTSANIVESAGFITETEFREIFPGGYQETDYLPKPKELLGSSKDAFKRPAQVEGKLILSTWLDWQRYLQRTVQIGHSSDTEVLSSLLQYSDAKRFELPPSTQNPTFNSQHLATLNFAAPEKPKPPKKTKKAPLIKSPTKKCGDIRALFSTATKSTKNYTKLINDLGIQNDGSIATSLINLLVDLSLDSEAVRDCYICQKICNCSFIENIRKHRRKITKPLFLSNLVLPDIDLIDDLDVESITMCEKKINKSQDIFEDFKDSTYIEPNSNNFDLDFDFGSPNEIVSPNDLVGESGENTDKNFDLGDIEEIFADSSPEEAIIKEVEPKNESDPKEALGFFGLDSIEDIFVESDESRLEATAKENKTEINENNNKGNVDKLKVQKTESEIVYPVSPSILSGQIKSSKKPDTSPTSPILCTQARKFQLSTKRNQLKSSTPLGNAKRQLIPATTSSSSNIAPLHNNEPLSEKTTLNSNLTINTTNKSMFTITQLVEMINKTDGTITMPSVSKTLEIPKVQDDDDGSTSPILLSQAVRKKLEPKRSLNTSIKSNKSVLLDKNVQSLIILDSDSDSNASNDNEATQMYDIEDIKSDSIFNESKVKEPFRSPLSNKRKLEFVDDEVSATNASPYFNKRQKIDNHEKPLTLQDKVLAALNRSQKLSDTAHDSSVNFMFSQKENENPHENIIIPKSDDDKEKNIRRNNLDMLQAFRRDSQIKNPKKLFENSPVRKVSWQRRKPLSDSDDDFVTDNRRSQRPATNVDNHKLTTNHKVRKKKAKNSFLDLEAEVSDASGSSDERSDERSDASAGSVADFLCDEPVSHEDMRAHYMRAVTGTVNGAFKIPELPAKFKREEIFSQFVEEDSYEMDSFCVDSHIGLTQVNDVSELELAEIILEERKSKKKPQQDQPNETKNDDSPLIIRRKRSKRQIQSDSDDSS